MSELSYEMSSSDEGDGRSTEGLRILGLFVILIASLVGSLTPVLPGPASVLLGGGRVRTWMRGLCAGALLGLGFIHILADSFTSFQTVADISTNTDDLLINYPWASFCALLGVICNCVLESVLCAAMNATTHSHVLPVVVHTNLATDADGNGEKLSEGKGASDEGKGVIEDPPVRDHLMAYMVELGCCFHSVIIGIDLGLMTTDYVGVTTYVVVLCFHQLMEGLGLGAIVHQAHFNPLKAYAMCVLYSLTTPIGVAIGIGASTTLDPDSLNANIVKGVFNGVSAGLLIYVAIAGLLVEELRRLHAEVAASPEIARKATLTRLGMYGCMLLGAGIMAVIGIWA